MGYQRALEVCGVEIVEFKEFGSYHGDWFALLSDGRIVPGSYGSCSVCDAFQAEFGYYEEITQQENGKYFKDNRSWDDEAEITKEQADEENAGYLERLRNFGEGYINGAETLDEVIQRYTVKCEGEYSWDDDKEILEWLKSLQK